ncbi:MAG: cell division protein FtsL [Mariprofundus sp.]|nr:cell division protein FtsL [Mariprofundus sp.]
MPAWLKLWLLVPASAAVFAGGLIWLSHLRYELSLESQRVTAAKQMIGQESNRLRLEVASLTRPERLRQYARDKLNMAPPNPMQVIHP